MGEVPVQLSLFRLEDFIPEESRLVIKDYWGGKQVLDKTKIRSIELIKQSDGGELFYLTWHPDKQMAHSFPISKEQADFLLNMR